MTANSNLRSRKLLWVATLFLLASGVATAQTKTIRFESGTWEEIKARSTQENKLIFLDAYTTWCGYCKKMEKTVFTDDAVADYFNANFINVKMDMERGEGIALARQYSIYVYPTLLFIDGQGNVVHRAEGGLESVGFIELGRAAQNSDKPTVVVKTSEASTREPVKEKSNKTEIGYNISQYQKDFGIGVHFISPYFLRKSVAIKAGTNMQWFESSDGIETTWTTYQNIQVGVRGRRTNVTHNVSIYGEGGVLIILPNKEFSSQRSVVGGYGLFGFEFRVLPGFAYFIELGGVGTGATADKIAGKPIYSTGFLTNAGLRIGF